MLINDPATVAELRELYPRYEAALVANDVPTLTAARNATHRMVDLLIATWGLTPEHAYLLCSVAMKLQISQVVNEPMITVSAAIAKSILPPRTLFPLS